MDDIIQISITENSNIVYVGVEECGLSRIYVDGITITGDGLTPATALTAVSSPVIDIDLTGSNSNVYQNNGLIGKTIISVFTDGLRRKQLVYSFDSDTGTVVFTSVIENDSEIGILCR